MQIVCQVFFRQKPPLNCANNPALQTITNKIGYLFRVLWPEVAKWLILLLLACG